MKLNVTVYGSLPDIWQSLLATLYAREYKVESQSPYTALTASRGSKAVSLLLETTKGGYRDLVVTLAPGAGSAIDAEFDFRFPSWALTWSDAKQECEDTVAEFAAAARSGVPAAPTPGQPGLPPQSASAAPAGYAPPPTPDQAHSSGDTCKACGVTIRPGARFCDSCGASLAIPSACPRCGQPLVPNGTFCEKCGTRVRP